MTKRQEARKTPKARKTGQQIATTHRDPMAGEEPDAQPGKTGRGASLAARQPCGAKTRRCACGHHMKQHEGHRGGCSECLMAVQQKRGGATACDEFRPKLCCVRTGLGRGGRCQMHGGKSLAGAAHPSFRWERSLPVTLRGMFTEAMKDRQLLHLRQDVALVDAMLTTYMASLGGKKKNMQLTEAQERRIVNLTEQRRRLGESEARRLRDLRQVVTREQFGAVMGFLSGLFREYVPANQLGEVQQRIQRFMFDNLGHKASQVSGEAAAGE